MKADRIQINLNPSKDDERRVLDYLRYSPLSYSKTLIPAVLAYLDMQEGLTENERLLQQVSDTVRKTLQEFWRNLPDSQPMPSASVLIEQDQDEVSPLDFLKEMEYASTSEKN